MQSMAKPNAVHMAPSAKQFSKLMNTPVSQSVASTDHYESPTGIKARAQSKLTRGSNVYNFHNADIAEERGRPNALGKETMGTVYGGSIGAE
jgi:hypothetical protein